MMFHRFINVILLGAVVLTSNTATADENTLERIKREGVIHTGTEPAFEPFEFLEGGKTVGYDMDILHEIARRMGVKVDQHDMDFGALLPSLAAQKIDLIATALTPTAERAKKFLFTDPVSDMSTVILTQKNNNSIHNKDDLASRIAGTQQNSGLATYLAKQDEILKQKTGKGLEKITYFQSFPETLMALKNNTIEATIVPLPMAANFLSKNPGQFRIAGWWDKEANDKAVWAVRLSDRELQTEINKHLEALEKDGTLKMLQEKWFGKSVHELKDGAHDS